MTTSGDVPQWTLCERLTKSLRHANVTKSEMAEYLRLSESTISNYLTGRTHIPHAVLLVWADRTNVSLTWLADGDGDC